MRFGSVLESVGNRDLPRQGLAGTGGLVLPALAPPLGAPTISSGPTSEALYASWLSESSQTAHQGALCL